MPRQRASKPKPKPPERRYMVKYLTKSGAIRTRFVYSTSPEGAESQCVGAIGFAKIHSCEYKPTPMEAAAL